jgi:hypothetical protein
MSTELKLETIFGPDTAEVFREEMRRIARAEAASSADDWLDVRQAMEFTRLGEWHVRQLARKLQAQGSPDVYQPNPGKKPLRIRRSALRDLKAS